MAPSCRLEQHSKQAAVRLSPTNSPELQPEALPVAALGTGTDSDSGRLDSPGVVLAADCESLAA